MGEVAHIVTDDLRFSIDETDELFREQYRQPLEEEVLREVDSRTRGWAASLQLFHGSMRGKSSTAVRALARSLSGEASPIYDFLAEEVLGNLPEAIDEMLVRCSLLRPIVAGRVVALFGGDATPPTTEEAAAWIEDADRLGLLSRVSQSTESRQLHPLLRDFLERRLKQRHSLSAIAGMHLRVASAVMTTDPLAATHHFLEGGQEADAMRCLGASVMVTMGSGQWGVASRLIERLQGVPADPAVAAIQARRLIEDGELANAAGLLASVDESGSTPDVRAVFRYAKLSLGWRTGDRDLMFATLERIRDDADTPTIFRDIAQVFIDASPMSAAPVPYPMLARRMERMSQSQHEAGYHYYAAISLHNASIASAAAGQQRDAIRLCNGALDLYERLSGPASERFSTHAVLASRWFELGDERIAEQHVAMGLASGDEHGDVPAEFAYLYAVVGKTSRAVQLLGSADRLKEHGLSDLQGTTTATMARAILLLGSDPNGALALLSDLPRERPLDVGDTLGLVALESLCMLSANRREEAANHALSALAEASALGARSAEVRLRLIVAIAGQSPEEMRRAISAAHEIGHLALLEAADALVRELHLLGRPPLALLDSMTRWPERWLPLLRRALEFGASPHGRAAAAILEEVGEFEDVARLRAYEKTYGRRIKGKATAGRSLVKRVGPRLHIQDLGRVLLRIGDREIDLISSRRKPASLLMYLVTRPKLTAHRDEVLDSLWPDADPTSASNSLNQSLFYIRRAIDPWYEDDMSVDYIRLEGELVWLDSDLTRVGSTSFLEQTLATKAMGAEAVSMLLRSYAGKFAPEFEYEEWAMAWRTRLHAAFLELSTTAINEAMQNGNHGLALDLASYVLSVDPAATDLERRIVQIYWRMGARLSALAHYDRLVFQDRADGVDPPTLRELVGHDGPE
jgi:DNA-binding SARP family transcriptional activator